MKKQDDSFRKKEVFGSNLGRGTENPRVCNDFCHRPSCALCKYGLEQMIWN